MNFNQNVQSVSALDLARVAHDLTDHDARCLVAFCRDCGSVTVAGCPEDVAFMQARFDFTCCSEEGLMLA